MSDDKSTSGNRWESSDDQPTEPVRAPEDSPAPESAAPVAARDAAPAYAPPKVRMPRRSKAIIGGAAAGLLLVGGVGGFALGAAVAGDDDGGFGRHQRLPGDGPFGQEGQAPSELGSGSGTDPGSAT